ncbi:MAG TPA: ATP synthase F0 subunit B [Candidatus Limnocylindria bacterium]|jgi:F-type H+-transporting ATPase subunit b|nr:ATP synthase F0 subunit B [Candidatus Limnocylindria bacterium]
MEGGFFEAVALWSQVAGAVAFLVVVILLFRKYLMPAVKANQDARNAEIAEAEARRERINAELAQARGELTRADEDAVEIRARVAVAENREREKLLADARHEGERLIQNAQGELERARLAARDRLRIEMIEKALVKARGEAARRVDAATETRLVEATLDDLTRGRG